METVRVSTEISYPSRQPTVDMEPSGSALAAAGCDRASTCERLYECGLRRGRRPTDRNPIANGSARGGIAAQLHESCKAKLPAAELHSTCASVADLVTPPTLPRENAAIGATRGVLSSRERCRCEPTSECSTASQGDAKLHSGAELHSPTRSAIFTPRPGMMRD